jgi:hypothetical protein
VSQLNEGEFLFPPYSAFELLSVDFTHGTFFLFLKIFLLRFFLNKYVFYLFHLAGIHIEGKQSTIYVIRVRALEDNQEEDEDLPLAPWS